MFVCLGIDPGFVKLGFSACAIEDGNLEPGLAGIISQVRTPEQSYNEYLNSGIYNICEQFPQIVSLTKPDLILAELVPVGRLGSRSELVVAAVTACKVLARIAQIPWKDIAASTWKKELLGDGLASKTQIRNHLLEQFPSLKTHHKKLKEAQKAEGAKAIGLEQDLFDALAISQIGCQLYGQ